MVLIEGFEIITELVKYLFTNFLVPLVAISYVALFVVVQYLLIKFYIFLGKNIFIGITNLINWYSGNQKVQGFVGTIRDLVEE